MSCSLLECSVKVKLNKKLSQIINRFFHFCFHFRLCSAGAVVAHLRSDLRRKVSCHPSSTSATSELKFLCRPSYWCQGEFLKMLSFFWAFSFNEFFRCLSTFSSEANVFGIIFNSNFTLSNPFWSAWIQINKGKLNF